jgi:hypothetical protein
MDLDLHEYTILKWDTGDHPVSFVDSIKLIYGVPGIYYYDIGEIIAFAEREDVLRGIFELN